MRLSAILQRLPAFLPFAMIAFGFLTRAHLLDSRLYNGDNAFAIVVELYIIASLLYLYKARQAPHKKTIEWPYLIVFHLLTALFILLVTGFTSAFPAVWILLLISTMLTYGYLGGLLSFISLAACGAVYVAIYPILQYPIVLAVIQEVLILGLVGYFLAFIILSAIRDRLALDRVRSQENFQRERLLALVNSMGDAVVTTNDQGNINVYNAAFLNLLDTNGNLVGKPIDEVLHTVDQADKRVNLLADAQAMQKVFSRTDLSHRFNADENIRLYINVAPIHAEYQTKGERGYIFIIRDITKEKTLEEERDEFIAIIGHELRTPVTIVEGSLSNLQLLQQRGAPAAILQQTMAEAHEQTLYLAKLINDLALLSRAERGVNANGMDEVNATILLTDMYKHYLPRAQKGGVRLDLDLSPHLPLVRTSRTYVEEILQNLVDNALKYTPDGGTVTLIGRHTRQGVYIGVKDTGIGISKTDQKHIFNKFYRSEDYRTRESTGTGLGLYISQKLAEKLGLRIAFESRLNHGSLFGLLIKPAQQ